MLSDTLKLALRFGGHAAGIAADAVRDPFGGALPLLPERVVDTRRLDRLFVEYGLGDATGWAGGVTAELRDLRCPSSNCNNRVVALAPSGPAPAVQVPASAFLKLPSTSLTTRAFCNLLGIWRLECLFYRNVAPRLPIRVPAAYVVAAQGSRFVLVLEDLHAVASVRLHTNADLMAGASLEIARRCLDTLARMHASLHGLAAADREAMLPAQLHPFASPRSRPLNVSLNRASVGPCRRRAPEIFGAEHARMFLRAFDHWDTLVEHWYREPTTLCHGDSHLGNFFCDGDRMGMLDFQAPHFGQGVRDVQYFLTNSLPVDRLAAHERELVEHYVARRGEFGAPLAFDEAWSQYRGFSFQTLMTHVVSLGLGTLTENDAVVRELLARAVAASERLDFEDWLDRTLAEAGSASAA
jgi:hypothetical protein